MPQAREQPGGGDRQGEKPQGSWRGGDDHAEQGQTPEQGDQRQRDEPVGEQAQLDAAGQRDAPALDVEDAPAAAEDEAVGADTVRLLGSHSHRQDVARTATDTAGQFGPRPMRPLPWPTRRPHAASSPCAP